MRHREQGALIAVVGSLLVSSCNADLVVDLTQSGSGVVASLSGTGTVTVPSGGNPGSILNFNNFPGTPFGPGIAPATQFTLLTPLSISGTDDSDGGAAYTSSFGTLVLDNTGSGGSDLDLRGSFSIGDDDTYTAAGSSVVAGLQFSDLNVGSYVSTDSDAADFGSVRLNITAIPEPGSVALLSAAALFAAFRLRRRRKATRPTAR